ncbi:MAG: DUF1858 domain-containing protein [Lachnospiraceae bacterium]|nr:DUF1858 domain-containing protein [Lachnospiraceae bacterium]
MITLDMIVGDLIKEDERAISLLAESGMNCVGCGSVAHETFEEACKTHGLDPVLEMRKMNIRLYGRIC